MKQTPTSQKYLIFCLLVCFCANLVYTVPYVPYGVTLTSNTTSVREGERVHYTLNFTNTNTSTCTVTLAFMDGTARYGMNNDYIYFPPLNEDYPLLTIEHSNLTSGNIEEFQVYTIIDNVTEPTELFHIWIIYATCGFDPKMYDVAMTLYDTPAPVVSISNWTQVEGDSGSSAFVFTVSVSLATNVSISSAVGFSYTTADGTAKAGADYASASGSGYLYINQNVPDTVNIPITVYGDALNEMDETFFVNLSLTTQDFIVRYKLGYSQGVGTILNDDPIPYLSVAPFIDVNEGNGTYNATVFLSQASGKDITVSYATSSGLASDSDYTPTNGTLLFPAGQTTQWISIPIIQDSLNEFNEDFQLNLFSAVNANITVSTQTITIIDDDPLPNLTITPAVATVNEGVGIYAVMVSLSQPSGRPVSVSFATASGTATADADFTSTNGVLTFTPGQVSQTIAVPIIQDTLDEFTESFQLNLFSAVNAMISVPTLTININDDDPLPYCSIAAVPAPSVREDAGVANFLISLSATSGKDVFVHFLQSPGTATANLDYTPISMDLTIPSGMPNTIIGVPIIRDSINEPSEIFIAVINNPINCVLATSSVAETILNV